MTTTIAALTDDHCRALAMVAERPRRHDRLVVDLSDDLSGADAPGRGSEALTWLDAHGLASGPSSDLGVWQLTSQGRAMLGQVQSRVGGQ
ncbi:hypothetical protein [Patulibacter sp.]|uniref:hypothetical protein n=1 Tax=Patulibacter sp. TaxID=1912859 RepID=UPI0027165910|nr:hypothetical protein [Patulibacter sp.]MDO9407653.1 hypothetical protein [Patulibacter sp.]